MVNRREFLEEMGITPIWRLRDRTGREDTQAPDADDATSADDALHASGDREGDPGSATNMTNANTDTEASASPAAGSAVTPAVSGYRARDGMPGASRPAARRPAPAVEDKVNDDERAARIARMTLDQLKVEVKSCTACSLCKTRHQTVFGVGDESADWMIVGEAPGAEEDARGEPFVGQAGKLLDNMLAAIDLARDKNVYIANVLKCRPPGNRNPEPAEVARCSPHLVRQIQLVQPKIILAMGRFAAQALLDSDATIASMRGKVYRYQGVPTIVTYHPAYLLRNLPDKANAWEDLCFARRTMGISPSAGQTLSAAPPPQRIIAAILLAIAGFGPISGLLRYATDVSHTSPGCRLALPGRV